MAIDFEDDNEHVRRIVLSGRLDLPGTEAIEAKFAALATSGQRHVLVDLTSVSFIASIGIRALITTAKAVQKNGGKMVLLVGGNKAVVKPLETTGIDDLIPMFADSSQAIRAALD